MDFQPIRTKKIYQEIIDQIKGLIAKGSLKPGDKLMSERELAEKMQVGRSAVREAFRALEAMKVIEIRPGEGTYIREASADSIADALSLVLQADQKTASELMELRKILEVECARLAAKRRSGRDLTAMKKALEQMAKDIENGDLGDRADLAFHYSVAKAASNTMVLRLMTTIADTMMHVMRTARVELYRDPKLPHKLLQEHLIIYQAIANSDSEAAQKAMYDHLQGIESAVFNKKNQSS
ncbi:FadR/GntR family transcriptional regulator [Desulfofalx alkaliphila]|uniref:FadR/GntR family transcriptional regulator n=1 Tax=Desulfofalx alkaliphila TaxID=105483 RepID=UPI0004E14407|nr:FadR/GntR family transcriptional regulator [Desulfofalx alkaliphila]